MHLTGALPVDPLLGLLSVTMGRLDRGVKVLRLVTLGKSNSEIAEELVISLNTVACHVSRILNKTNSANRSEVAAYTIRHGHSPTITSRRYPQLYDAFSPWFACQRRSHAVPSLHRLHRSTVDDCGRGSRLFLEARIARNAPGEVTSFGGQNSSGKCLGDLFTD